MSPFERRNEIMKVLCRRRYETVSNLASEFNVSPRTIARDIEALSVTEPIYTQCGRYGGGVYVMDGYSIDRIYMSDMEIGVLKKLYSATERYKSILTYEEKLTLSSLISQYSKPKTN